LAREDVGARTAGDAIVPEPAANPVAAALAAEAVPATIAVDRVAAGAAGDPVVAGSSTGDAVLDGGCARRADAVATYLIGTRAAVNRVVAGQPQHGVVAAQPG
jgi:hypothetical protein